MVKIGNASNVDAIVMRLKDMGNRVSKVKTTVLRIAALSCLEACAEQTPVRSGALLDNWHIGANGPTEEFDSKRKDAYEAQVDALIVQGKGYSKKPPVAEKSGILADVLARAEMEALEIDRDRNVSSVVVYNPAPYAPAVDNGSATNVPRHMSEAGREAASQALGAFRFGIGTEDYDNMSASVKIGRRKAGE